MTPKLTYKDAGVDLDLESATTSGFTELARRTYGPNVIVSRSDFAGLYSLLLADGRRSIFDHYRDPVLAAGTDSVGTKLMVAFLAGRHDTVGIDAVAMCVNDVLCVGARPIFFLDYIGTGHLDREQATAILRGVVAGCRQAGCALLGGETATLAGLYQPGEYDLVGFSVGVVERSGIVDGSTIRPGHLLVGLASSGLHSNGFTLVRKVLLEVAGMGLDEEPEELGCSLADELLRPTRIYVRSVLEQLHYYRVKRVIGGIAHVTGGGLPGNLARVLPPGCAARIKRGSWPVPPIFGLVQRVGGVDEEEMYRVFNMGIGMVLIVSPYYAQALCRRLRRAGETPHVIGRVVRGNRGVTIT
ncbi:MAG: phosphoribosylformylglycinamidine cyclo-ligase [Planctomycetes bacterium]|nr:phosphoribosylformylglycinamidine cyclo-ligase [Planctomycetota bacterium]